MIYPPTAATTGMTLIAAIAVLSGCERGGAWPQAPGVVDQPVDTGYREPPQLRGVSPSAQGGTVLTGRALPGAVIRLAALGGATSEATADSAGLWRVELSGAKSAMIYGLSEAVGGRRVQAEGYFAVLPGAEPLVAELRAGAGAVVRADRADAGLLAVDLDSGGAAAVSGRVEANQPVRLLVDGVTAVEGSASADGRFSLTLPKVLTRGPHRLMAVAPGRAAAAELEIGPPSIAPGAVFRASQHAGAWRIDWRTPAGGEQTTLVLGTRGAGA